MIRHSLIATLLFLSASLLTPSLSQESGVEVCNLRTESLSTPMGIDTPRPLFSWQLNSQRNGAAQKSYRLLLAESPEALQGSGCLYDTGFIFSDKSLNIRYEGPALKACSRYWWKVQVIDELGKQSESEASWFDTGLMTQGWSGAKWIGSEELGVSKYRTNFIIDYNVTIPQGSSRAVFVYSAKDKDNYISVELNIEDKPRLIVDYCVEGELRHLSTIDISSVVPKETAHSQHSVKLDVNTPGYHLKSNLIASVDGVVLKPTEGVSKAPRRENVSSGNPYQMTIDPYPDGRRVHDWARLHSIGFKQPKGHSAEFSDIRISESNWGQTLYTDPQSKRLVKGNGKLSVWEPYGQVSAPMLRRALTIDKPLKSAKLYLTARGIYEFYINGRRVSNDYFNPGWTDYRYRIMYNSYDVTSMLAEGSNALSAMLGSGWYSDLNIFTSAYVDPYGIRQSLLAKLVLEFEDGSRQTIVSDESWKKYDQGPVVRNGFQFGEDYDARKEVAHWKDGSFDDSAWKSADILEAPDYKVDIQSYVGLPIQNNITLTACSVSEPVKGTFVYDFGQNVVGVPRLEGMKAARGRRIELRFAEMTYPEIIPENPVPPYTREVYEKMKGQAYIENYRGAISIDTYTFAGREEGEDYQPIFTDHGFRYVSITGLDKPLPLESVKAVVLESIGECTSSFESSNPLVNRLYENILWGQRGNFQSVPTDCPQRDERQGWTGDAQVFARTATYFSPWVDKFYARWFYSMRDNQNKDGSYFNYYPVTGRPPVGFTNNQPGWIGWMDAGIIVPYQVWMQYGDISVLEEHYPSMVRYMDYLERMAQDYLQPATGIGDHLALERTDLGLTNTAYYAYDARMMSRMAEALGKKDDSRRYALLYENIKRAFNARYFDSEGRTVSNTQTSYALPLAFGVVDESLKDKATENLVQNIRQKGNTLTTGFIGTPCLNVALSENGRDDVAFDLFEQTAYPSWLYPVLQGATTMWERWNSYTIENGFGPVDMNSFNHYAYGAIGEWMYAHLLGIQRDEKAPAYKHIILQPKVGGSLEWVKGGFETPYGKVESSWKKVEGGYIYSVRIPANTSASLTLQAPSKESVSIVSGAGTASPLRSLEGKVMAELQSGYYEFKVKL